ncbi:CLIP domain-containing serine protease B4-like [Ochlerotatus camptorhynchus]|uniref:CLIP domain-containing serine protease B4-like n=1 Tax=Ochlerotatus camptorhynchus TaxID=644619 RepID=UPI0031D8610C
MRMKEFYLVTGLVVCLNNFQTCVRGEDAVSDDDASEELDDASSVPPFVRSRFNLRIWSTAEDYKSTGKTGSPFDAVVATKKSNRFRINTVKSTTSEAATDGTTTDGTATEESTPTTTQVPMSSTTDTETTTSKSMATKLSAPECGKLSGDDVPWIAILEHTNPNGGVQKKTLSKGVLIDDRHVLTTISSIHNSYPFWVVTGIRLGDTPTWAASKGSKEMNSRKRDVVSIPVRNVFLHEKKDIAVIRLSERVNITEKIRPICLPANDRFNYTDMYFHICKKDKSGFGRMGISSKLIAVTYLSQKDCQILFRRHKAELGLKEFCVWDETGDNCTGDLGGPLMVKLDGRYHVIGLNSYALLAKSKIDSEGLPGVYVRVGSFSKWIQAVLKTEFDDLPAAA